MKYATNRDQRIAYDMTGVGPAVVLQHGFLDSRKSWAELGYVEALADKYTVICVDSLGHGDSDKPVEQGLYVREQRADDIVAVLDAEDIGRAHFVGYSMGGWLGTGLLAHRADRLLSITIGGFDPFNLNEMLADIKIDDFLAMAGSVAPELIDWVTEDVKPGLAACLAALKVAEIPEQTLIDSPVPVHLWVGTEDDCYQGMKTLATKIAGAAYNEVPGDHIAAMATSNAASAKAIREFLELQA